MYQGETIRTTISGFPVPVASIRELKIIFKNNYKTFLEKTLKDCTVSGETVIFELTQEESLSLPTGKIDRSVIIITKDGSRIESCPSPIICSGTARDEVILP